MHLLDTCALIWLVTDPSRFPDATRKRLDDSDEPLFVSAISAFEIALLVQKGRMKLPRPPADWYAESIAYYNMIEVPVSGVIAARSALLPPLHGDPCDRIIVATALQEGLGIVTPDALVGGYPGVRIVWD